MEGKIDPGFDLMILQFEYFNGPECTFENNCFKFGLVQRGGSKSDKKAKKKFVKSRKKTDYNMISKKFVKLHSTKKIV